jgi:hypothetical protein
VFENRVLRRIFGPTGKWRKLHNEELCDLFSSRSIISIMMSRRMRWEEYVARMGRRGSHIGYWWKRQREKGPLGRARCMWVYNSRMDVGDMRLGDVDWIGLAQDRNRWRAFVNSVLNHWGP